MIQLPKQFGFSSMESPAIRSRMQGSQAFNAESNDTTMGSPLMVPAHLLNAFIPGYSIIASAVSSLLGFDISALVSIAFFLVTLAAAFRFVWARTYSTVINLCTYAVILNPGDAIYDDLMRWIARQKTIPERARSLRVSMPGSQADHGYSSYNPSLDDNDEYLFEMEGDAKSSAIFNFAAAQAKKPLRFSPSLGSHPFWHKGNLFMLEIYEKKNGLSGLGFGGHGRNADLNFEETRLRCFGLSMQPIKNLLEEIRASNMSQQFTKTSIYRPPTYPHLSRNPWKRVSSRMNRPLHTVDLDHQVKKRLVKDINHFLKPSSARWYSARGIPYRRGYLFSGLPGTGKSSISFALAGIFGLSIYAVSLEEGNTGEEELCNMMSTLPLRALVLIEDIDAAGIAREPADSAADAKDSDAPSYLSKRAPGHARVADPAKKKSISLSGLLNAIDGVASHEGHILIMTTNFPERLDAALKRPGRIDMHVEFTLASHGQIKDVFLRMFTSSSEQPDVGSGNNSVTGYKNATTIEEACRSGSTFTESTNLSHSKQATFPLEDDPLLGPSISSEQIAALADEFAAKVPSDIFSPAEVQGYLLEKLGDPLSAVEGAEEWVQRGLKHKEKEKQRKEDEDKVAKVAEDTKGETEGKEHALVNGVK